MSEAPTESKQADETNTDEAADLWYKLALPLVLNAYAAGTVSYTHLTLPTKRIV